VKREGVTARLRIMGMEMEEGNLHIYVHYIDNTQHGYITITTPRSTDVEVPQQSLWALLLYFIVQCHRWRIFDDLTLNNKQAPQTPRAGTTGNILSSVGGYFIKIGKNINVGTRNLTNGIHYHWIRGYSLVSSR
jgi:hypothetical protein